MKKGVNYLKSLTLRDITKMSDKEIKALTKSAKGILLERYKQQKSTTGVAPIWRGNNPYKIATSKTGREQDIRTLTRELELLNDKTTSQRGYQTWLNRQMRYLDVGNLTESQIKKIWDAYDKINESDNSLKYKIDYNMIVRRIAESVKANTRISYKGIEDAIGKLSVQELGYDYRTEGVDVT